MFNGKGFVVRNKLFDKGSISQVRKIAKNKSGKMQKKRYTKEQILFTFKQATYDALIKGTCKKWKFQVL